MLTKTRVCFWQRSLSNFHGKELVFEFKAQRAIRTDKSRQGKDSIVHIHIFILKEPIEIPFPSVDSLRKEAMIQKTIVLRESKNSIQVKCRHFKIVPHMLTSECGRECFDRSRASSRDWKHIRNLNFGKSRQAMTVARRGCKKVLSPLSRRINKSMRG
jgi:hypothetical protein